MDRDLEVLALWTELKDMDRVALRIAWRKAFKTDAPPYLSLQFMRKALIWHQQTCRFGGMSAATKRALRAARDGKEVSQVGAGLRPGTHLVREWHGRRYLVEVLENGFRMNGKTYKSLSAIALQITGTT